MYKLKRKICNLKPDLFINKNGDMLYSFKDDDKLYFNEDIICSGEIFSYRLYNKSIYISKKDEKILKHNNIVKKIKTNAGFFVVDEYKVLFNIYSDDYSKQFYKMYDFLEEKEYWTIEKYFGSFIKNNNFLYASCLNNKICKIDLDHPAQPLWQFDLSQLGTFVDNYSKETKPYKVEKFIGIYANELLLACSGQKLLSIDIQTGKLLQTWDDVPADKMQLDKQAEKLIGLSDYLYAEVDLNTRETLVKNVKNNIEEAGLRAFKGGRDMPFTDTHIFYTAYGRDTKTDYLFDAVTAFNRHTRKIDWMYRIDASVGTNSPKLAGNKLYQLDSDGNLYIFEKKENVLILPSTDKQPK